MIPLVHLLITHSSKFAQTNKICTFADFAQMLLIDLCKVIKEIARRTTGAKGCNFLAGFLQFNQFDSMSESYEKILHSNCDDSDSKSNVQLFAIH